jgi:hypothetical protein
VDHARTHKRSTSERVSVSVSVRASECERECRYVRGRAYDRVVLGLRCRGRLEPEAVQHLQRIDHQIQIRVVAQTCPTPAQASAGTTDELLRGREQRGGTYL